LPSLQQLESRLLLSSTAYLSFGPSTSVVTGYTTVDLSPFDATRGFGWTAANGLSTVTRSGPDPLHQKFIEGASNGSIASFKIKLDPGTYKFTFHLGDQAQSHSDMKLSVDGATLDQHLSTTPGQFIDRTWTGEVSRSGQALVNIQAAAGSTFALDGLDITPYFDSTLTAPSTLPINTPGTFSLSTPTVGGPYTFTFNFGDGSPQQQTTSSSVTHSYAGDGDYRVTTQVTDFYGRWVSLYTTVTATGASHFYIDPTGNDASDGSAAHPWATVNGPANHNRFGPGDQILFKGGATFQGPFLLGSNLAGTAADPVTISSFGTGRARITSAAGRDGIGITNAGGVLIKTLDLVGPWTANLRPPSNAAQSGIFFYNTSGRTLDYVHVDDVNISGYAGMGIQVYANQTSKYRDISITNSLITGDYGSGIYIYSRFGQNYQLEKVYIGHVEVLSNYAIPYVQYPAFPIYLQNVQDGVVERSVVFDNDLTCSNPTGGGIGIEAAESTRIVFQHNESAHNFTTGSVLDSGGFDFDGGTNNSIMQYNYAHDNDGEGFLLCDGIPGSGPNTHNVVRFNVSQNDGRRNAYGGIILTDGNIDNADIYNNTVYTGPNTTGRHVAAFSIQDAAVPSHVHVRNNIFATYNGAFLVSVATPGTDLLIQGNDYWTHGDPFRIEWQYTTYTALDGPGGLRSVASAANFEKVGTIAVQMLVDPHLINMGFGGTVGNSDALESQLTAYRLQSTATASLNQFSLGVAWDPDGFAGDSFLNRYFDPNATDFYDHAFGQRTIWSMGADQGT
jgi:hypothetical protein